jgi:hypothetical protein
MTRVANDLNVCVRVNYAYTGFAAAPLRPGFVLAEQGHEYTIEPKTRIAIDPNVRVRGNGTYAGFEDVSGPIAVGDQVEVYEGESNLVGQGRVTEIDVERELVYLSVDWSSLSDEVVPQVPQAETTAGRVLFLPVLTSLTHDEPAWMRLVARPSLACLVPTDTGTAVVAPAYGWSSNLARTWTLSQSSATLSASDYVGNNLVAVNA